jgi:multidrug efflux pump subunit AcrA (membrane-fusion protein)
MSKLNGGKEPLTYGEALVAMVGRVSWPNEEIAAEVDEVVRKEHKLWNEPDAVVDPEDIARQKELEALRAERAELLAARDRAAKDAELEALRKERDELAAAGPKGKGK